MKAKISKTTGGKMTAGEKFWKREDARADFMAKLHGTVEIWKDDSTALADLVKAICANKRLAWAIVHQCLEDNNYRLIPYNPKDEIHTLEAVIKYQEWLQKNGQPMTINKREMGELRETLDAMKIESWEK